MSDNNGGASRRQLVTGMAVGLAGAMTGAASAQARPTAQIGSSPNPVDQYTRPPFDRQTQAVPGLAGKMVPRPDHGETSYKGSGRLAGRKALVTGGDSGIGCAAAIAFAREGADVAIGYLPFEEADAAEVLALIRAEGRKAVAVPGDIREQAFCEAMVATAVRELGGLDILVNNAGAQQSVADLVDLTAEQFDTTFKTNVYAPFWITKAALPHLKPRASIIITASVQAFNPSAQSNRLFPDQSCERRLRQVAREATRPQGHQGERGGAGPVLDGPAAQRRAVAGQACDVWGGHPARAPWAARRDRAALYDAGLRRGDLQ